jgi:aminomethyltransferase
MKSPLDSWHVAAGAKMADFGGWDMPIEYATGFGVDRPGGVLAEHAAVRERVGIFDVSHLGKMSVVGSGARSFVNSLLTNDLEKISVGQAQYNLLCNDAGGVIDDLIVYIKSDEEIFIIPNAANCGDVVRVFQKAAPTGVVVTNLHTQYAVLAVQGPQSSLLMKELGVEIALDYMSFAEVVIPGHEAWGPVIVCRTGYTGEHGFELLPSSSHALALWEALVALVDKLDGRVCGLGARDTLRTEMGYPLHGHELSLDISPLQAAAGWAVALDKEIFHGQAALLAEKSSGVSRISRALRCSDRGIPRGGMSVLNEAGEIVGEVTSGTFSPTLKTGIALALVNPEYKVGANLIIDVRGRQSQAEVVRLPFVESHVR